MAAELLVVTSATVSASARRPSDRPGDSAQSVATRYGTILLTVGTSLGTVGSVVREGAVLRGSIATSPQALAGDSTDLASRGAEGGRCEVSIAEDGKVIVRNDGVGFIPFYWGVTDGQFSGSTSLGLLSSVLGSTHRSWREDSVIEYLTMLHPLEDRTMLAAFRELPAGSSLTWHPSRSCAPLVNSQPLFAPDRQTAPSDDDAVRQFATLWPEVLAGVEQRSDTLRLAVGLSGGLDSRAVATGLSDLGAHPLGLTYVRKGNRETSVARSVADALAMDHLELPVREGAMLQGWSSSADDLDGVHSPAELYERWFADQLRDHTDVLVSGLWGGPLWGGDKAFGLTTVSDVLRSVLHRYQPSLSSVVPLLRDDLAAEAPRLLRSSLQASLVPFEECGPYGDLSVFWNVANRQRRWGLALASSTRRQGLRLEAPFLDARFLRFAASLTPAQRRNGRLHLRVQREVLAATAAIPRGNDGNAPVALDHVYWSGDQPLPTQLLGLAMHHPVSASRRTRYQAEAVLAPRLGRGPLASWAAGVRRRELLFDASHFVATSPAYRRRLVDMLSAAVNAGHPLLKIAELDRSATSLKSGGPPRHAPLALARAATLCLWHQRWGETSGQATGFTAR